MTITLWQGDCLERMKGIPDNSIDMVLVDLPYGTTQNKWDSIIPLSPMWGLLNKVTKINGAMVFTAQSPFDKILGSSNIENLKYEWVWEKPKATGHLNSKKQPMKAHENILVFYRQQSIYYPIKTQGIPYKGSGGSSKNDNYGNFKDIREGSRDGSRYPRSVLKIKHETNPIHPTQKPVKLMEYLIKTYTLGGETVLDFTMGSGTTGVACRNLSRSFIGIERDATYFGIACKRMNTMPS